MNTKTCKGCKQEKDMSYFWNEKKTKDGKNRYCRDCVIKKNQIRQQTYQQDLLNIKIPKTKVCTLCNQEKDISCFWNIQSHKDGKSHYCRDCRKKQDKIRQQVNHQNLLNIEAPKTKICNTCKQEKERSCFWDEKKSKDGKNGCCSNCMRKKGKIYQQTYHQNPLNKLKEKERGKRRRAIYHTPEYNTKQREKRKKYDLTHKKAPVDYKKKYERFKNNPNEMIKHYLRNRINKVLKGNCKDAHTMELIGCSFEFFQQYFESLFKQEMTWKNHGRYGWHIDHIIPCVTFDFSKPEEQRKCFHYTNLQPLWATTKIAREHGDFESIGNLDKGDSII